MVRVAKLMGKQDRIVWCLKGYIIIFGSSSSNGSDSDDSDIDPLPAANAYSIAGDCKGKGRRGSGEAPPSLI